MDPPPSSLPMDPRENAASTSTDISANSRMKYNVINVQFIPNQKPALSISVATLDDIYQRKSEIFLELKTFSTFDRLAISLQLVLCLQSLHERSKVHGSLSPGCVIVHRNDGRSARAALNASITVKYAGLYEAASRDERFMKVSEPTRYIAPEHLMKYEKGLAPTKEGDVYGCALVTFAILQGEPLFPKWSHTQCVGAIVREDKILSIKQPEGVPDEVWCLLRDCWTKEPEQRPPISEVARRLSTYLEQVSV